MIKFLGVALAFFVVCSAQTAVACSCMGHTTPCGSYAMAQAVFVGSVRSVNSTKNKDEEDRDWVVGQTATVQVEKVFKGAVNPEVTFKSFGTSCDPTYVEGQRWLFYAHFDKKERAWVIAACDRSSLVEHASDDLLYLEGLPKAAQTTRLAGTVLFSSGLGANTQTDGPNLLGTKITIKGSEKTYQAYTDTHGVYEVYGLPAGLYDVSVEPPTGTKLWFSSVSHLAEIQQALSNNRRGSGAMGRLVDKSCLTVNFFLKSTSSISGHLIGQDGKPLPRVCLELFKSDADIKSKERTSTVFGCTKGDGSFTLEDIPSGNYIIVANRDGLITSEEPFRTTYYPGTTDRAKATEIVIGVGDVRKDFDVRISQQAERFTLSGSLTYSDGTPAEDASVVFMPAGSSEGDTREARTEVDAQGRFELPVLTGLKGTLIGTFFARPDEYTCAETQKWVKANDTSFINSNSLEMQVIGDVTDIKLVLPVPYCRKLKP